MRGVMFMDLSSCVILCFVLHLVFSAKSKSSFSIGKVHLQVPQHLKSGKQLSYQRGPCYVYPHAVSIISTWEWLPCPSHPAFRKKEGAKAGSRLPRKEVIQPHLPVRLPCYDFTPITDPTLDACLSSRKKS